MKIKSGLPTALSRVKEFRYKNIHFGFDYSYLKAKYSLTIIYVT